jgi:hypothetical protein
MSDLSIDAAPPGAAQAWFGDAFERLHPLLQRLHRGGGMLEGVIAIDTGPGIAGVLGRRLAARLGVPVAHQQCRFQVHISHESHRMVWARRFIFPDGSSRQLTSIFTPHGAYPDGYWSETTGAMTLRLGVDITAGGGWQWRPMRVRLAGVPLPLSLFPTSRAGKRIENQQYRFQVVFSMPFLGRLLEYGGLLTPVFASPADKQYP